MEHTDSIKKMLVALIMIIAAALLITMVAALFIKPSRKDASQTNGNKNVEKQAVAVSALPDKFPTNIPLEAGATVTQNYNATAVAGGFQATRSFQTAKSLGENLNIYSKYLTDNGWLVTSTINEPAYKAVTGKKGPQQLQISMTTNSATAVKTVTISLTESE